MKSEDDLVDKEIPVFLSNALTNQLYNIQYPFYTEYYDEATIYKVSIKPKNQKLRMELLMNTENTESYDHELGEKLALNAENEFKGNDENKNMFSSGLMNKIVLASEKKLMDSNYAVGIFQDGEFHITQMKNIMCMRAQYNYLDESEKRVKEGMKSTGEDDDEDEDNPSPVKVTFARHLPDNVKKKQEQSFHHHTKKVHEEHWTHTNYISSYDKQAELTRMEMLSSSEWLNDLNSEPLQYIQRLAPDVPENHYSQNLPEDQQDLHYILTMPLLNQIRIIMKRVRIISFAKLRELLLMEHDTKELLKCLQQVAVLVQGNWIVNSELIYPKDAQNGLSELMCKARDYILLLFTEQQFVNRKKLSSVIKLKSEDVDEILEGFAMCVPEKGWELRVSPNWSFCDKHPEIVQWQELFWNAKRKNLREMLETQNQPLQRQRRKSHRESIGSENEERNVGRGRKSLRDSSLSDDSTSEPAKHKKSTRSRKVSETM